MGNLDIVDELDCNGDLGRLADKENGSGGEEFAAERKGHASCEVEGIQIRSDSAEEGTEESCFARC